MIRFAERFAAALAASRAAETPEEGFATALAAYRTAAHAERAYWMAWLGE
jgi:hypothetical protein